MAKRLLIVLGLMASMGLCSLGANSGAFALSQNDCTGASVIGISWVPLNPIEISAGASSVTNEPAATTISVNSLESPYFNVSSIVIHNVIMLDGEVLASPQAHKIGYNRLASFGYSAIEPDRPAHRLYSSLFVSPAPSTLEKRVLAPATGKGVGS